MPFRWSRKFQPKKLAPKESTNYLGFLLGFEVAVEIRHQVTIIAIKQKLAY